MSKPETLRISPAKLALAVKRLRAEKENLDLIASDPIAVIGMGCRFPGGADSPEAFWTALQEGRDCVGEIPTGRWKDAAALPADLRKGGYLSEIDRFDAAFFGISPREAQQIDPQQRLLLEVTWEALWNAGIEPAALAGTDTGAFVAIYNSDYARLHFRDTANMTAYAAIGAAHSVAAGRLSFLLNIRGPSLAIDSACSSSLVATHLACQSLRTGECGVAIVGASSLKLLSDEVLVFTKWGMLASDGKCKTFDASADGFAAGEGCGALILKRLSDALRDGDRVRAVIRGTAVNHDGRTTVLTAPSGLAQEAVLRTALANAMLEPGEVSYIETHGTGTSLGDPIEIEAVSAVYGNAEPEGQACVLGAVKTNLGHLEASAGIAGLIKVVLCLENGEIPRNLHFHQLNPEISLAGSRLTIPTENTPWMRGAIPRVAGISSFGLGGTNSHIVVEEAPLLPVRNSADGGRAIPLPAHAWQRQRFWLPEDFRPNTAERKNFPAAVVSTCSGNSLLGTRIDSPFVQGALYASELNTNATPYLADHRLGEHPFLPFAAFLEIAAAAIRESNPTEHLAIENFALCEPCFVSNNHRAVQVLVGDHTVEIATEGATGWAAHAKGTFRTATEKMEHVEPEELHGRCSQAVVPGEFYKKLEQRGLRYDSAFRTIHSLWSGPGESLALLRISEELRDEAERYGIHPTLLDGCLQAVIAARADKNKELFLPSGVDSFDLQKTGVPEIWVHTMVISASEESFSADLTLFDSAGQTVASLLGFTAKRANINLLKNAAGALEGGASALLYELDWQVSSATNSSESSNSSKVGERWLVIESQPGQCAALAETLRRLGAICEIVPNTTSNTAILQATAWTGIVYDARGSEPVTENSSWHHAEKPSIQFILNFVKSLKNSDGSIPKLWLISAGAVSVLPGEDIAVAEAPMWGMVRTLALEHPEVSPVLIDAGPYDEELGNLSESANILAEEIKNGAEPLVAFRQGKRYVARLVRSDSRPENIFHSDTVQKLQIDASGRLEDLRMESATRPEPQPDEVEIQVRGKIVLAVGGCEKHGKIGDWVSHGTVLVTGGLGALGIEVARWLASQGAKSIVLAGRKTSEAAEHPIALELGRQGVHVAVEHADVSDPASLEKLLKKIRATDLPLRAVFHAAGVVQDSVLSNESWQSYTETTASKIDGAWNLHRLTQQDPVQCMVFFSSAASILGSPGQGSYSAGNAFLDALAHYRASRGQRTFSVNWGAWASAGMAARLAPEQTARLARQGMKPLSPAAALAALQTIIESGRTQTAVLDMDWHKFLNSAPTRHDATLFVGLYKERGSKVLPPASIDKKNDDIRARIVSAPASEGKFILSVHVKTCARRVLGLEESAAIPDHVPLQEVGLDSLMALEMRNELAQSLGVSLAAGLLFDYPAVGDLTQHLLSLIAVADSSSSAAQAMDQTDSSIVGLEALSDEEAERLLLQELDRSEREKANV